MRYIPLNNFICPKKYDETDNTEWLANSATILIDLVNESDRDVRNEIIERKSKHWLKLRRFLLHLSYSKCWFSEARNDFAILEVEHFRPKKLVKREEGSLEQDGYWWLAFDWRNYRMCAKIANTKKGILFPLADHSPIATYGGLSTDNEVIIFLDPTRLGDPDLLSFNEDGKAVAYDDSDDFSKKRVDATVKYLHLDFARLEDARKETWKQCINLIEECRFIANIKPMGSAESERLRKTKEQLQTMIDQKSPFSAVAITCLLKSNIGWAMRLVRS